VRLSSQRSKTVISPIKVGLDSEAVSSASPRLWLESSSPDTILGHKSNYLELQLLGSRRGRPARARARPLSMGGPSESGRSAWWKRPRAPTAVAITGGSDPLWVDPTGGFAAASGHGPGRPESAGRCAGRWSQP